MDVIRTYFGNSKPINQTWANRKSPLHLLRSRTNKSGTTYKLTSPTKGTLLYLGIRNNGQSKDFLK